MPKKDNLFTKLFDKGLITENPSNHWIPAATKDGIWENYFVTDNGNLFHLMEGWMLNVDTRELASPEKTGNFNHMDYGDEPQVNYIVLAQHRHEPEMLKAFENQKLRNRLFKKGFILETPPSSWSAVSSKDKKWKNYYDSKDGVLLHLTNGWLINETTGEFKQIEGF